MSEEQKAPEAVEEQTTPQAEVAVEEAPASEEKAAKKESKPKAAKAEAGDFNWEDFETKGFGEGYSKKKKKKSWLQCMKTH